MRIRILALAGLLVMSGQQAATAESNPLSDAFAKASSGYDVPRDLLVALAYAESRLDGHQGKPSASGGYGMMHLVPKAVQQAAEITSTPVERLRADDAANILGGAAVLRAKADALGMDAGARKDLSKWYAAVGAYGGSSNTATIYADAVYEALSTGIDTRGVTVKAQAVQPERGPDGEPFAEAAAVDYPDAIWKPALSSNYTVANRPASAPINKIIIHVAQGTYAGTISWFQDVRAKTSSHYVIRSSDGQITQMVREKDRAWHARNANTNSIGIEHEGYIDNAAWFTDQMYRSSAALVRNIADRYNIPKTRANILGHVEVPGNDHTDPGPNWDWAKYMSYITGGASNPHTPASVCGTGYSVIDSAPLGTDGTVYLLYSAASGKNCVATMKQTQLGTASPASAFLEVQGSPRAEDKGNFSYYAGPVSAAAPNTCVKWGGSVGNSSYTSPFEHCG
ncbi:N-acetylmuramoyl-L-alanine amidase [Nonomuraea longicatena]|uniref:N-acetylmuramoyl-L-alanine amidase n=1 Tax=Nonomuraea longicatena TaxID=83682 RepID=A0ABP3ZQX9_9ACTN